MINLIIKIAEVFYPGKLRVYQYLAPDFNLEAIITCDLPTITADLAVD